MIHQYGCEIYGTGKECTCDPEHKRKLRVPVGNVPVSNRFVSTSDRRAWRAYAAAALGSILNTAEDDPSDITELAALLADGMLAEERKRR